MDTYFSQSVLELCEMQKASYRILTQVSVYISDDSTIYQPLRSGRIWHKVNF